MRVSQHITISVIASSGAYLLTKSTGLSLSMLISGIFIDLDHIPDYFVNIGKIKFDFKDFIRKCDSYELKKVYLFLHSFELLIILALITYFYRNSILIGITLGLTVHILLDAIFNYGHTFTYFFIYRYMKKFELKTLYRVEEVTTLKNKNK